MSGNTVCLIGNITRDPELRFTPSGAATATFGLAVNERWQNRQTNEWEESTSFFDVVCWRDLAEHVSDSLGRGTRVMVTGKLKQRSWESQEGEKRSKIEVVADEVGPSLRWANAEVKKTERRGPDGGSSNSSNGASSGHQSSNYQSTNHQSSNDSYANAPAGDSGWAEDEEPF